MKILIIGLYNNLGGIEKCIFDYICHMNKSDIQIDLLGNPEHVWFEEKFKEMGCRILPTAKRFFFFNYIKDLYTIMKNNKYDLVHCNILSCANLLPIFIASVLGVKIIVHSHNSSSPISRLNMKSFIRNLLHLINKQILKTIKCYRLSCSETAAIYMFGRKKYTLLNNAVDVDRFAFNTSLREKVRKELNIDNDTLLIGQVGRFEYQKNHEFSLKLFSEYLKVNSKAKLLFIGKGTLLEKCKRLATELHIENDVIFYGFSPNVNEFLSAFDIFLFPSHFEGLSVAGIEAQCAGLPIIASDTISREMEITDLVFWCSLFSPIEVWIKCIELARKKVRKDYSNEITKNKYNIRIEAEKLRNIYKEVSLWS